MPPKARKAGGDGGAAGKKGKTAASNSMDELRNLEELHNVLDKEQQLRNYFQLERDKVYELWEASKKELEMEQYRAQNAESELEEMERAHQVELKVYKQKVRHILYDHKVTVKQLKEESDGRLQQAEVTHEKTMTDIEAEKGKLGKGLRSSLEQHEAAVAEQRDSHAYMVSVTKRQNHEKELARLRASYEAKLSSLREDLELRRRAEINEAEEQRNEHINQLIRQHEEKFAEMKMYYNGITKNNLEIIQSLKDEIATLKQNDAQNESLMYDIEAENQHLVAPLEQARKDVAELQLKKQQYLQVKESLQMTRGRLRTLQEDLKHLRSSHAELEANYKKVYEEREELKSSFEVSLRDAMGVVEERNAALQQSLIEANARVEERDTQVDAVLQAMRLEPGVMHVVAQEIDQELASKNQVIKDLHFELRKLEKRTGAVLTEYERRCRTVGIPVLARDNFAEVA